MSLLIQTGFLSECVNYIEERWRSKAQVGKLEQYGYGYLLSQMANTPAVISRLDRSGFIEYMVDQLWSELEYVPDDLTSVFPRRFPSEPISRYALKVIDAMEIHRRRFDLSFIAVAESSVRCLIIFCCL